MNASQLPASAPVRPGRFVRWHRLTLSVCLIIFAFELGVFLLVFPWLSNWDSSWIPVHSQRFASIWMSPYFRGVLGGLGFLNLYVAFAEAVRFAKALFANKSSR